MIKQRGWGSYAFLIDQANTGHNDIIVERQGSILLLKTLICSIRAAVAGPILSRLLVVDGSVDNAGITTAGKWNSDLTGAGAGIIDGKILLDTVVSSAEPAFAPALTKPLRAISGKLTIVLFSGYTLAGVIDASAWGYLCADGEEISPASDADNLLQTAKLR